MEVTLFLNRLLTPLSSTSTYLERDEVTTSTSRLIREPPVLINRLSHRQVAERASADEAHVIMLWQAGHKGAENSAEEVGGLPQWEGGWNYTMSRQLAGHSWRGKKACAIAPHGGV
jgi:hypothetical protein